jgi:DNA-binding MarR family transcriptional regulator
MNESPDARVPDKRPVEVAERFHSAAIHLLRSLRRQDDSTGITAPRLSALSVVVFAGPLTLGELAAAEQVRPPTMSRLVSSLEAEGLVVRVGDTQDRRVVRVSATPAGVRMLEAGKERRIASLAKRLHRLEPQEVAILEQAATIVEKVVKDPE